ncbi:MAG: pyrroline-5-carboxylate reductase [Planctomycetota bacterium]|nr:pyrroline-5-carboxylate reductase [Planctomycetota bacterium]
MAPYTLGVLGFGKMAQAILRGALEVKCLSPTAVVAYDPDEKQQAAARAMGIALADNAPAAAGCPRVLLAVKPQMMAPVLAQIAASVPETATVVSIAAGITAGAIDRGLGGKGRIVRVMPNTPMQVGAGASAIAAGPRAGQADLDWTRELFAAGGLAVVVEERLLDAVTGLSGSGPAYFFYFVEALAAAGVAEGLPPDVAAQLALQTCVGAGRLLARSGKTPQELRVQVTTPGGTTQRALETMDAAGLKAALAQAVHAAVLRSRELGK